LHTSAGAAYIGEVGLADLGPTRAVFAGKGRDGRLSGSAPQDIHEHTTRAPKRVEGGGTARPPRGPPNTLAHGCTRSRGHDTRGSRTHGEAGSFHTPPPHTHTHKRTIAPHLPCVRRALQGVLLDGGQLQLQLLHAHLHPLPRQQLQAVKGAVAQHRHVGALLRHGPVLDGVALPAGDAGGGEQAAELLHAQRHLHKAPREQRRPGTHRPRAGQHTASGSRAGAHRQTGGEPARGCVCVCQPGVVHRREGSRRHTSQPCGGCVWVGAVRCSLNSHGAAAGWDAGGGTHQGTRQHCGLHVLVLQVNAVLHEVPNDDRRTRLLHRRGAAVRRVQHVVCRARVGVRWGGVGARTRGRDRGGPTKRGRSSPPPSNTQKEGFTQPRSEGTGRAKETNSKQAVPAASGQVQQPGPGPSSHVQLELITMGLRPMRYTYFSHQSVT
jgi:hypothetical protein